MELLTNLFSYIPAPSAPPSPSPIVDIFDSGNEIIVYAQVPGIKKEDIKVSVNLNHQLTILVTRHNPYSSANSKDVHAYQEESVYGTSTRTIRLPVITNVKEANVTISNGILEIRFAKYTDSVIIDILGQKKNGSVVG